MSAATLPSVPGLAQAMVAAAEASLGADLPRARDYARPEFQRLLQAAADIGALVAAGKVSDAEARSLFDIHRNTARMVLLSVEGMGLLAAENALNSALGAARDAVNGALGFVLI